jgi:hypothetical protein
MIAENYKIVPVWVQPVDFNAATDTDSIDMSGYHKATFIYMFETCGAAVVHSMNCGLTTGAKTTAVPFKHALGGAAIGTAVAGSTASCDVLGAWADASTTASITATTKMVVCEVDAAAMDMANGYKWLTGTTTCASGIGFCLVILEPRYSGNRSVTALA